MDPPESLRVIQLTPPGGGAVACVLVEGAGAADLVQNLVYTKSGRRQTGFPGNRLVLGRFNGEKGEEVVLRQRSPNSVELHCHGGYAAAAMIEETLRKRGCRVVDWRQWVLESAADAIAAAALVCLADAPTLRARPAYCSTNIMGHCDLRSMQSSKTLKKVIFQRPDPGWIRFGHISPWEGI